MTSGLHAIVESHAARVPGGEALALHRADATVCRLTWRELHAETRRRAALLRARGTPDLIIVELTRGLTSTISLLAASALGAEVLPVDSLTERQRRAWLHRTAPTHPVRWLVTGEQVTEVGRAGPRRAAPAYVLPTGGSTGTPKLVRFPFRQAGPPPLMYTRCGWRDGQRRFIAGTLGHSAAFTCLVATFADAGTAILTEIFDPPAVARLLGAEHVEWAQLTPTHMRLLQTHLDRAAGWTRLGAVLHTGGPCPPDTKRAWIDALGAERVYDMYAATEGIGVTLCRGDEWLARPGTVGRGFCCRIKILDERGRPVPDGTVGTVHLRTLPSRHAERRAPAPYRTVGDLGWKDGDGYLYLVGRADDMVLIGGENVYLGDVDAVVLSHPEVTDAAVVPVADEDFGTRLVGLVVVRAGAALSAKELAQHCLMSLPVPAVPRRWRFVDSLRRTENGKTRQSVLRDLAAGGA
ncbi:class I adenylate-forming enzyme family protein [Nonomuraea sp. SBT364]|uniref:class I adenylate-forming enzyme family protein n=1 Tax=Nonomuraea sp. SBT364 TaxID=1580530 RepID=UPI00066D6E65|nr:AMP-binding protein [Nonomuraea sp. SBT364]